MSAPIGTRLTYEDEYVRVWTLDLNPGEQTPVHQHSCDYVYVVVSGGSTETHYSDGSVEACDDRLGESVYHAAGLPHSLRNVGSTVYRNIIVELLETGPGNG
ncbi:cupin domain-containing protein [Nonomuraea sp. SBT364]|uniref:cupin domain-containing protein n=1 Tax=Nonomuraea sp. SBT364 TaxID=1580530 RepID=UPI0009EAB0B3|nr:hypothetical protein [Nonomuraea sp. SBT364]